MFEEERAEFPGRLRSGRGEERAKGSCHGHRNRQLTGKLGSETVRFPRARIEDDAGPAAKWRSKALPRCKRLTKKAEALSAANCLAGTSIRRVKRALSGLFEGAVRKDVVSRVWRNRRRVDLSQRKAPPPWAIVEGLKDVPQRSNGSGAHLPA